MPLSALFPALTRRAAQVRFRPARLRWRRGTRHLALTVFCVSAIVTMLGAPGTAALNPVAERAQASGQAGIGRGTPAPGAAASDVAVTASGDTSGYHLYVTSARALWRWRALATILPGGDDEQRWIGQQCLTGDGRTIVAVIAPWSANNSETGMDAGAFAYTVSVATGAVRPLAAGVSLAYFDPGCGAASAVALTSYLGAAQRPTRVTVYDAATGRRVQTATVRAQITSAVPVGGRILAAEGANLVDITSGQPVSLHHFEGQLASLTPTADDRVDLLAQRAAGQMSLWQAGRGMAASLLATGSQAGMRLLAGAGGHNIVANASRLTAGSGLRAVSLPGAAAPTGASAGGGLLMVADTAAKTSVTSSADPDVVIWHPGTPRSSRVTLPPTATDAVLATPAASLAPATRAGVAPATGAVARVAAGAGGTGDDTTPPQPETTVPQCAVPRNDVFKQVWQPGADQVRWAVNQAALNALSPTYTAVQRPTDNGIYTVNDADYTPLPTLFPSKSWPLANLVPGASPAVTVPPLVMYGILAQESNWDQASWHAAVGRSGNPLVADYYGTNNPKTPSGTVDYDNADCGYGIAQATTGMQNPAYHDLNSTPLPAATQVTLAVDYASNIAYGESILQEKWNQLKSLGITLNDGDPTKIENWYAAIWAYNSGVYTGGPGQQGLGWYNNPANPMYPFDRHTFLHIGTEQTPGDAANPQSWPYQEKVFGWMEVPLTVGGVFDYRGTYDWDTGTGAFVEIPAEDAFCSLSVNNCNPGDIATAYDPCSAENSSCWWSAPAQTVSDDCAAICTTDTVTNAPLNHEYFYTPGLPEPDDPAQSATCTLGANTPVTTSSGALIPGTVIVDDEMIAAQNPHGLTPNLMGCSSANSALVPPASANASFSLLGPAPDDSPIDAAASPAELAAVDVHQLGGGIGGHIFFTHTGDSETDEARGRWAATLPANTTTGTAYQIYAFIPNIGAATGHATYEINPGPKGTAGMENPAMEDPDGINVLDRTINQGNYSNQWVSLGYYLCDGNVKYQSSCTMTVTLRSATLAANDPTQGADIAFNAIAFVPASTGGYVALGDSYSSGEGAYYPDNPSNRDLYDDGTDVSNNAGEFGDIPDPNHPYGEPQFTATGDHGDLCHRSSLSWPQLLAAAKGLPIVDLTCSGSNLGDVAGTRYWLDQKTQNKSFLGLPFYQLDIANDGTVQPPSSPATPTAPPDGWEADTPNNESAGSAYYGEPNYQVDLLRALHPRLVTVTVGGNDVGFADILETCIVESPCKTDFANSSGPDKISKRITSLQPLLASAYTAIKAAAGTSNVYAITYPAPIDSNSSETDDCTMIVPSDRAWLASKIPAMATAVMNAAGQAGIKYVNISTLFNGHGPCAGDLGEVPYVNAPDFRPNGCSTTACMDTWFHPNKFGYQAMEAAIAAKVSY